MFELLIFDEFKASLDACPQGLKQQAMDTVRRLKVDPGHPGLQAHRLNSAPGKWECCVNLALAHYLRLGRGDAAPVFGLPCALDFRKDKADSTR